MDVQKAPDGAEKLTGSVEGVIYANEQNGYTILDFGTDGHELVTLVGIMPYVAEGDELTVYGKWVHNPKYGRQFAVEQFEKRLPSDSAAILRYLSSGAVRGVGPKKAQKLVDLFGEDTFEVLENHPDWLTQVPGFSRRSAEEVSAEFRRQSGVRTAMMFFREHFGATLTVRICNAWGAGAVERAKKDPYALCDEIEGVGFEKADALAKSLGFAPDGLPRVKCGVLYTLTYNANTNGHTCLPEDKLRDAAAELLSVPPELVTEAIHALTGERRLRKMRVRTNKGDVVYCFDKTSYENERLIAERLTMLDRTCAALDTADVAGFIAREEKQGHITYAELQKEAIAAALKNGVMVLTGGPGTGKTTVVRALLRIFDSMGLRVALSAPTGRAAKRLSEATSEEAKTVHRLLEMSYNEEGHAAFARGADNLLEEDVVIVDESSMLDTPLTAALLRAIKPGARVLFIGDADQLPPVGPGNVLRDIIASRRFATVALTEIFRQARGSLIVTNAHAINRGEMPDLTAKNNDFFFLPRRGDREIAETIADLCLTRLPRAYGPEIVGGVQIVAPSRRGEAGTENLNRSLQAALNPPAAHKREITVRDRVFREGDRVMQTRNNYELAWERGRENGCGVFNGDIGVIEDVDLKNHALTVAYDDRHATYDTSDLDDLEPAFAVTVHKSQGSEYPVIIMPLGSAPALLLTRNLFYTAVTRAQRMVILVGREEVAAAMVKNSKQSLRYTGLCARLAIRGEST